MFDLKNVKVNLNKKNNNNISMLLKYLPCLLKGEALFILGILVVSFAYFKLTGYSDILYYLTFLFMALGSFVTGRATYKRFGGRGIVTGILGSLPVAIINILIIYLFCYRNVSLFILLILPVSILSGAIGGILASNSKKRY